VKDVFNSFVNALSQTFLKVFLLQTGMTDEFDEFGEETGEEKMVGESRVVSKMKEKPWMLATIALGIVCVILFFLAFKPGMTGNVISGDAVGQKVVDFVNSRGGSASLMSVERQGDLYLVTISMEEGPVSVYATRDGENLIPSMIPLTSQVQQPQQQPSQNIQKSDVPEVELFVMTHCPYGTQAEKGFIPVMRKLGDSINAKIRFVHYFMHAPEETETPIQVCIREEQSEKYLDYLECFLGEGDSDKCLTEAKINKAKLDDCVETNADKYYEEDSQLSQQYGVKGSPTLVINGKIVSSGRNPNSFLSTVCSAFNTKPEECSSELSTENPTPGFGYPASSNSGTAKSSNPGTTGSCG
jgi:glutaredoxin